MLKTDTNSHHSYEIRPIVQINASAGEVWKFLIDLESWWVKSNSEHISLSIDEPEKGLKTGTRITVREKIAGIPCKAIGKITIYSPHNLVEWQAKYFLFGFKWIRVSAGVRWELKPLSNNKICLMANVWADFPNNIGYSLMWFLFKNIMNGIRKDYNHAMKELIYIKKTVESNTNY